jgi:hypothetical protein
LQDFSQTKDEFRRVGDQQELKEQKRINELHEKMLLEHSEKQAKMEQDKLNQSARFEKDI